MSGTRRFFKVFLASPGDLAEERRAAKRVVDEYNGHLAEKLGYHADLVGWEDTLPGMGRPQALINRDLEGCDLFVGMLWKRWGTAPDDGGKFTSGFEEEFYLSLQRFASEKRPEIQLLLKEIDEAALVDPGDQLKRVQEFRKQVFSERKLLAKSFSDINDFERVFRLCIQSFAIALADLDVKREPQKSRPEAQSLEPQPNLESTDAADGSPLSKEGFSFLRGLLSNFQRGKDWAASAPEIARFRLLSSMAGLHENDESTLGVHDSNLLFRDRKIVNLSAQEQLALIDSGLEHYKNENVPLWHWIAAIDGFARQILVLTSVTTSSTVRKIAAISAMRLLSENIRADDGIDRDAILSAWLEDSDSREVRNAALGYLAQCGTLADLPRLRGELDKNNYQVEKDTINAILAILARDAPEKLFSTLIELRPATVNRKLLSRVITNTRPATDLLLSGLDQGSSDVRLRVVSELRRRKALPVATAEKLLGDENAGVRYEALLVLTASGRIIQTDQAKAILVRKQEVAGRRGFGLSMAADSDSVGESNYQRYAREQKLTLPDANLVEEMKSAYFDQDAFLALVKRDPNVYRNELLAAIRDQYTARFAASLTNMSEAFSGHPDLIENTRGLGEFLRKKFTRQGLDLIANERDRADLDLVRTALRSGFVDYSPIDLEYLKQFGGWEDVPSIVESLGRPGAHGSSGIFADDNRHELASSVVYALAGDHIDELIGLEMPNRLFVRLMQLIATRRFRQIPETQLMALLRSKDELVRKATVLKIIATLSKKRVNEILSRYLSADQFYYNVIHWLDFGMSVPRQTMRRGAVLAMSDL